MTAVMERVGGVLSEKTIPELRSELARCLGMTAEALTRAGVVWVELERRGEDLSDLRRGIARFIPLIASGRLAAESVVTFAGRKRVLLALEGLPLDRQRALAAGELIEVVAPEDLGRVERVPLSALPASRLPAVFADGELLSPAEQRVRLGRRHRRHQPSDDTARHYRPRFDRDAGTVTVGRMAVRHADLLAELSGAAGPDRPPAADLPDAYKTVRVRLTDEEFARLQAAAKHAGLPDWEMGRKALRAFGLI